MKKIWVAFVVIATLGSVVPFNFRLQELSAFSVTDFLLTCCSLSSWGDILGNVLLFLPIGFTGYLARPVTESALKRMLIVFLTAVAIALTLQLLQILLPSRDENLQDVVFNAVGAGAGLVLAFAAAKLIPAQAGEAKALSIVPMALIFCWLIYRLIPFVPSLDWQMLKNSMRPVFNTPVDLVAMLRELAAWSVFAYLLRLSRQDVELDRYLVIAAAAIFGLEIIIVYNSVTLTNLLAAAIAAILWFSWLRKSVAPEWILIGLLAVVFVVDGFAPFQLRTDPVSMNWLPFSGFMRGSMFINVQTAAEKVFLYGSCVFLLTKIRDKYLLSTLLAFTWIMMIEFGQLLFAEHTPEITDGLLVLLAAMALYILRGDKGENFASSNVRG